MNSNVAIVGALVADAAALGLHWLYDQERIRLIETTGPVLFRQPDGAHYQDIKGYFAHHSRRSGQLSHYGESARLVAVLAATDQWSPMAHQQRFLEVFGPGGEYVGYADRPTRALVARILDEGDKLEALSGMDDDQLPALAVVPGLFAAGCSLENVRTAASVISTHHEAVAGSHVLFDCLNELHNGASLEQALSNSARAADGELGELLQEALDWPDDDSLKLAMHFGMACQVKQGLPVVWHALKHARDFESVVQTNVRCGGDSCGRSMALGAIAGLAFDLPPGMLERLPADVRYDLARLC